MNIIERQVSQATRDGDTFTIPPANVCKRYTGLAFTVIYDLLELGADQDTILERMHAMDVPINWRDNERICTLIRHVGRIVIDEWLGPVTHHSHVEPV